MKEYVAFARELKVSPQISETIDREILTLLNKLAQQSLEYTKLSRLWLLFENAIRAFRRGLGNVPHDDHASTADRLFQFGLPVDRTTSYWKRC